MDALETLLWERTSIAVELGHVAGIATAVYALGHEEHDCAAYRI